MGGVLLTAVVVDRESVNPAIAPPDSGESFWVGPEAPLLSREIRVDQAFGKRLEGGLS
jgi:hypothetical protein